MKSYDCVVVGAGAAGLAASLYLARFGLSVAMVEKTSPGGQMLSTFEIANYPGFPKGTEGWNLVDAFVAHLDGFPVERISGAVLGLRREGNRHYVQVGGETVEAKTVIVATGAVHKTLGLEDEERLTGRGVSYCAMCDAMFFKNKVVAVVGGGNAALEEALHLANIVQKIYIIHRRLHFRADRVFQDKVAERSDCIHPLRDSIVTRLHGEDKLTGVTVEPAMGGEARILDVDGLFVFVGMAPTVDFLPPELELDGEGFVVTDCEMRTSVPGLFAAGDARSKNCRQVVTAVGDGATAAYSAFAYIEKLQD